jgi:SAM-dependent methyltransferase
VQSENDINCQIDKNLFPSLYHAHHKHFQADIPFWLDLARRQGSPILELGCGTGRVLIPLAETGFNVFGLDNNPEMLAFCKQRITPGISTNVKTILADLTSFNIEFRFNLILLPCNTYSALEVPSRKSTLACISQHLAPGGLFAVSVPNPDVLSQLETSDDPEFEMIFDHPATGNPVQVSYNTIRTEQHITLVWNYDQLLPNGVVDRITVSTQHKLTTTAEYYQEFAQAGYAVQASYGDFDYSPHNCEAPNLVILTKVS